MRFPVLSTFSTLTIYFLRALPALTFYDFNLLCLKASHSSANTFSKILQPLTFWVLRLSLSPALLVLESLLLLIFPVLKILSVEVSLILRCLQVETFYVLRVQLGLIFWLPWSFTFLTLSTFPAVKFGILSSLPLFSTWPFKKHIIGQKFLALRTSLS